MKSFTHKLLGAAIGLASIFYTNTICAQSTGAETIDINNISAMLHTSGDHFWDLVASARFEVPKGSRKHTIWASALWMGAYNNNKLYTAAMTYRQSGSDFWPGPLDTATATISATNSNNWDMMWNVKKADIEVFKADNNRATVAIKTWPAHGNTAKGEAKYLAPFVDVDKDGIYDYTKGDYPKIKGDQAIWWVFNDALAEHTESGSDPMGVEIHAMAYAFESEDTTLNNTLFFEYDIINRSNKNYKDMLLGIWTDFDLGYAMDDAMGCDSAQSAYFCYNADPFDDGVMGYGNRIPVQSVVFLQDSLKHFMTYNNEESNMGTPTGKEQHYNYLRSQMRNGDKLVNPVSNKETKFAYSGNPVTKSGWVMENTEVDKRGLGSTGALTLEAGNKHTFSFAYVTTYKTNGSINDNLTGMYNDVAKVKSYYNEQLLSAPEDDEKDRTNFTFNAYPNPANGILNLQWNNSKAETVSLVNMLGQVIWSEKISAAENKISINTKHFPGGIYMAVIENGSQKAVKRVVLQ